jgi:hypothetical protein
VSTLSKFYRGQFSVSGVGTSMHRVNKHAIPKLIIALITWKNMVTVRAKQMRLKLDLQWKE